MDAGYALNYNILSAEHEQNVYLMAHIKARPAPAGRRPLNLSVILDRSGSMRGDKLEYVKKAAQVLVQRLGANDRLSLVAYDQDVTVPIPPRAVIHKDTIRQVIQSIKTGGTTNLSGGWLEGCRLVAEGMAARRVPAHVIELFQPSDETAIVEGQVNRVLLLTDGLANEGITEPDRLAALAAQKRAEGIVTTTMGVGQDFNEDLLTRMATEGGGSFYYIDSPDQAPQIFAEELHDLLSVVGQNLVITLALSPDVTFVRQLNAYPHEAGGDTVTFRLGDLYADEIKILLVEMHVPALARLGEIEIARLRFDYDELGEGHVRHQTGELPIIVNVTPEPDPDREPDTTVVKNVLLLRAARAREEAIRHADRRDFKKASSTLAEAAEAIYDSSLDDPDLQTEHDMLREEAVDMEMGEQRYDAHMRKTTAAKSFHGHTARLSRLDQTSTLHMRTKELREALERSGATPAVIAWKREALDLSAVDLLCIGRAADNDIVVPENIVSAYHCKIIRNGDDLYLEDLGSTNGTFANGGRLYERFRLSAGDVVTVGSWLFRFLNKSPARPDGAPAQGQV
ncbi:MAG: VWA domain-containing protein [Anaerolineae bacterium]|nr:VWA domain-containing protein [Anaerolineae bacterium]